MGISYKKLKHLLVDKGMKQKDLKEKAHLGWTTMSKLSSNKEVSMKVLMKICEVLNCNIEDVMQFEKKE